MAVSILQIFARCAHTHSVYVTAFFMAGATALCAKWSGLVVPLKTDIHVPINIVAGHLAGVIV